MLTILDASPTHTNWAATIEIVFKSMLIQCTKIHPQLCQLCNTFNIEIAVVRVGRIIERSFRLNSDIDGTFLVP